MNAATPPESPFAPPASSLYRWEVSDKSISIYLSLDVVDRIERAVLEAFKAVTSRGSEVGGVLLGRSAQQLGKRVVTVESFAAVTCDYACGPRYLLSDADRKRLEETLARLEGRGPLSAVGFFRGNTRRDIVLEDEDLAVINAHFADPASVFLLVKPSAKKPSTGAFFFWENGEIRTESTHLPFPFKRAELERSFAHQLVGPDDASVAVAPPSKAAPAPHVSREEKQPPAKPKQNPVGRVLPKVEMPPAVPEEPVVRGGVAAALVPIHEIEEPPFTEPAAATSTLLFGDSSAVAPGALAAIASSAWLWTAVIVLVLAAVGYFTYFRKSAHPSASVQTASDKLDLKAEKMAGVAVLSWNWWSSVIRTAERATLTINDGDHREDVDLDLGQLRAGRVAYTPMTNDVSFRLEVTGLKYGTTQSNTIRFLVGRLSPIAPVLQPKLPQTQKPTRVEPAEQKPPE